MVFERVKIIPESFQAHLAFKSPIPIEYLTRWHHQPNRMLQQVFLQLKIPPKKANYTLRSRLKAQSGDILSFFLFSLMIFHIINNFRLFLTSSPSCLLDTTYSKAIRRNKAVIKRQLCRLSLHIRLIARRHYSCM